MPKDANRVAETATTTGTGTITLAGAILGHQTFGTAYGTGGNTDVNYGVLQNTTGEWEVGIGTFLGATNQLQRDTVLASSVGGSKVSLPAGSKTVYVQKPAEATLVTRARRATDVALDIRAASGQTANLIEAYNAVGALSAKLTAAGGWGFGSTVVSTASDLSRHVDLWGGTYGISVTTSHVNYVMPFGNAQRHEFYNGSEVVVSFGRHTDGTLLLESFGSLRLPIVGAVQFGSASNQIAPIASNSAIVATINGTAASRTDVAGTSSPAAITVITREKGDARYASISSLRYKDDVAAAGRIPGFLSLDPKTWTWGGDLAPDDFRRGQPGYGLVVEDLYAASAALVGLNDAGQPDTLNVGALIGALYAEIKELSARLDAIEA